MVDIDKIQYGFMLGSGAGDAVFVLRRLSKKLRPKNKKLFFFFLQTWKILFTRSQGKLLFLL